MCKCEPKDFRLILDFTDCTPYILNCQYSGKKCIWCVRFKFLLVCYHVTEGQG